MKNSDKKFISTYIKSQFKALENINNGSPYILSTYYFPSELACIYNVEVIYIERLVGLAVGMNMLDKDTTTPLHHGICSYQKAFLKLIEQKIIPKPQMIIAVRYPCKDAVKLCDYLHNTYKIPIFYLSLRQLRKDLEDVHHYLSSQYQVIEDIKDVVRRSNAAHDLKKTIDQYRRQYPGIIRSDDCLKIFPIENDFGKDSATCVLKELLSCIEKNISTYQKDNKTTICWMGLIPLSDNNMLTKIEKYTHCKFVYEEMWMFGDYKLYQDNFFDALTEKIKQSLFYNTYHRIHKIHDMMRQTHTEIVINLSHHNCSFLPQTIHQFKAYFEQKGITFYNISCDVVYEKFDSHSIIHSINKHVPYIGGENKDACLHLK